MFSSCYVKQSQQQQKCVTYFKTKITNYQALKGLSLINGPRGEKTCLQRFANNKGADQPAHPRSLISVFVIPFLESTISKLATSEISIF